MKRVFWIFLFFLSLGFFVGWRWILILEWKSIRTTENSHNIITTPKIEISVNRVFSWEILPNTRYIALTFDDGPHKIHTKKLLETLKKYNVPATFYVIGQNISWNELLLRSMYEQWHEIASHSWNHANYTKMNIKDIINDRDRTEKKIYESTGVWPSIYRPPYGLTSPKIQSIIERKAILWNVDPMDWKYKNTNNIIKNITTHTKNNSIILMHDIYKTSVESVPTIIENLRAQWYTFVTVSELLYRNQQTLGGTGTCMSGFDCY